MQEFSEGLIGPPGDWKWLKEEALRKLKEVALRKKLRYLIHLPSRQGLPGDKTAELHVKRKI